MKQTITSVLKEALERASPPTESLDLIKNSLKDFLEKFEKKLKKLGIGTEIFLGGSYAKNTMIRKKDYDIDIFVRFKDVKNISALTKKALKGFDFKTVHGSRDYFQIRITKDIFFEIIPVKKIAKPKDAENITDLSYSHVKYIKKSVKTKQFLDEIRLAKVFCYANNCYGAESYINGFSGYSLELLVYHYKGFLKFIRAMSKIKEKTVIDTEKLHKGKQSVLMDLNSSKLISPIILIDPTYKQRNVAAALSEDTFKNFQKICRKFLKNPSTKAFEYKKIDFDKIRKNAQKKGFESLFLEAKTNRQAGDIAGSKLLKFYRHLNEEIKRFFEVKNKEFDYGDKNSAKYFFAVKSKKEILIAGPITKDKKNVAKFKKKHKKVFMKNGKVYSKDKIDFEIKEFIKKWKLKNRKKMTDMGVVGLDFIA
jgi:tRNA nucleotidyltransferase (CCA-adding enzyme)